MSRPTRGPTIDLNAVAMTQDRFALVQLQNLTLASFTAVWTGSPVGTITVEGCNDAQVQANGVIVNGTGTWEPLPFTNQAGMTVTSLATGGSAGAALLALSSVPTAFLRFHYTFTSGTGSLTVTSYAKVS